jgi:hypothetical protein
LHQDCLLGLRGLLDLLVLLGQLSLLLQRCQVIQVIH